MRLILYISVMTNMVKGSI